MTLFHSDLYLSRLHFCVGMNLLTPWHYSVCRLQIFSNRKLVKHWKLRHQV